MQTRKRTLALLVVSAVGIAMLMLPATSASAALHSRHFKMPSKNIHCAMFNKNLRCDILSGLKPEPKRDCELDWTGLILTNKGKASPVCAGDTVAKQGSNTLEYGSRWSRNKITCKSKMTGLRCHNDAGHGFFLSRDEWRKF